MSLSSTKTPSKPGATGGGSISSAKQTCPEIKYLLVELVEVVIQNEEKWVKGAANAPVDTSVIKTGFERTDKDKDGSFKQYINIDRDVEGQDKRHPEYGREITFRARVKREDGKAERLDGVKIIFENICKKATNRENTDSTVWTDADLTGEQKAGFGSKGGTVATTVQTDDKGWTSPVSFFLSQYGGDQFKISAKLDLSVKTYRRRPPKYTKTYVVWRKFWYQMTYAEGFAAVQPSTAEKAYEEVFAEMVKSPERKFTANDLPEDLRERTFLEEYQVKKGGRDVKVAVIGAHNKEEFAKEKLYKRNEPKGTPLKANLIICEYQCDPSNSALSIFSLKENGGYVTVDSGTGGDIVCKPALRPLSKLVITGEWSRTLKPWKKGGDIIDKCLEIDKNRAGTRSVKVDLSKGATAIRGIVPVPSAKHPVYIKLKLETAEDFLGESFGKGQILCVYRPGVDNIKPTQANKQDYNNTVAHELGHMWTQVPEPDDQPDSIKDHPLQYVAHGGSGSHCRHGMRLLRNADYSTVSKDVRTSITRKAHARTHEVKSTVGFYKNNTVTVHGSKKTVAEVKDATHLKFTRSFKSKVGQVVEQKMSDYPVAWNNSGQEVPAPSDGDCMMFHSFSKFCSNKFCRICKIYLQLQDMSSLT